MIELLKQNNELWDFITWLRKKSIESGLIKILTYENTNLWGFCDFDLYHLLENYLVQESTSQKIKPQFVHKFEEYYRIFKTLMRFFMGKLFCKANSKETDRYSILVASYTNYWRDYAAPSSLKKDKRDKDFMMGDIVTFLKNRDYNVVALDQDVKFFVDFKTFIEKNILMKSVWNPVESYLTSDILKTTHRMAKEYKMMWNILKSDAIFLNSWNYRGTELGTIIIRFFNRFFEGRVFMLILYIQLLKRAIEIEKTDGIITSCGYCQLGRAATIAGKLKGVPTLEIQHGVIHPFHPGYIHPKDEISSDGNMKLSYYPIPDKTAVYGYYHKELLTKVSTYPVDSVIVTGQPRYDVLAIADKIYDKEKFLKKYNINPNHRLILWTTQCHCISNEENIKTFKAVFEIIQNLKDTTLVIKQHPKEGKGYTKMIKDHLNKYGIDAVISPKNSNIYEQLFVCDLMITRHSTTAMEAVALNKPVIILNLSGEPDSIEYVKEGVAFGVYDENDLKSTIENLLKDDSELAKNRKKYIERYLYKIDGKATERVVNLIMQMIEESRRKKELRDEGVKHDYKY